ncbi:hypothetical protein AYI68_g3542 [Smittium mucronatum]|uniref:Uncharacterized protein n=1 Tax=Smittium mucronatum TaxID=133383 RepID=A0A1R0GZL3_9FUNG|nr:hypothetical protein AYI68_g3542 [Smittium mucronatum]
MGKCADFPSNPALLEQTGKLLDEWRSKKFFFFSSELTITDKQLNWEQHKFFFGIRVARLLILEGINSKSTSLNQ